ncbi:MarR family transcriptional regulator [Chlorogloeopsis sp. ULAP02]|uniref:MarR family transcriptional regulator n=1 Tax=Chlorogloeopsis sp. ULAP02 TaxID=3107926 RepID=UPI003135778C
MMPSEQLKRAELAEALNWAGRELSAATVLFHSAIAEKLGLNTTDHKCADILAQTGAITAGELAERTGLTTGAITGVVDRLEKAGFVRRERDPSDRRQVIIQPIQEEMERQIAPLFGSMGQAIAELYSNYSDQELALILDFMNKSTKVLQQEATKLREEIH